MPAVRAKNKQTKDLGNILDVIYLVITFKQADTVDSQPTVNTNFTQYFNKH